MASLRFIVSAAALLLACAVLRTTAQPIALYGALSNFDAFNDCDVDAHGFEIELEGVTSVTYTFPCRYGTATKIPYVSAAGIPGTRIRWQATYDAVSNSWSKSTAPVLPNQVITSTNGHQCVTSPLTPNSNPCDHFGVGMGYYAGSNPTSSAYYWLIKDPAQNGTLKRCDVPLGIPHPGVYVVPNANAIPAVQHVIIQVQPPPPPPKVYPDCDFGLHACDGACRNYNTDPNNCGACGNVCGVGEPCSGGVCQIVCNATEGLSNCNNHCVNLQSSNDNCGACFFRCLATQKCGLGVCEDQYGDAQWVKVYKTEHPEEVSLDHLVTDDIAVPQVAADSELSWKLLQKSPPSGNTNGNSNRPPGDVLRLGGSPNSNSRSVVRRWEFYKFTGSYDPITHQAICADGLCNAPADNEVGNYQGAQMAGVNMAVTALKVTLAGTKIGSVVDDTGAISCGVTCSGLYNPGTVVTLTARVPSGGIFVGWSGACNGNSLTCVVTVDNNLAVTATFADVFKLSVNRGVFQSGDLVLGQTERLDCGKVCAPKVASGQVVNIYAVPDSRSRFVSWTGNCAPGVVPCCSGTNANTAVLITKDTSCTANFARI